MENTARKIAAVVAFVYAAGYCFGTWLHQLNDFLAAAIVQRPPTPPAFQHPLAEIAETLERLTVRELRSMSGIKRRMVKAQLVAAMVAA